MSNPQIDAACTCEDSEIEPHVCPCSDEIDPGDFCECCPFCEQECRIFSI